MSGAPVPAVLHYIGSDYDGGGVLSGLRHLAAEQRCAISIGVGPEFVAREDERLPVMRFPAVKSEDLGWRTLWQARLVAREAERWLAAWPERVLHVHSRAGLAAALWLERWGQRRVVASVHDCRKPRWFHRWAARSLGDRLFWPTPAAKHYYAVKVPGDEWAQCVPPGVPATTPRAGGGGGEGRVVRVGGLGALVSWKCWHLVLDALAAMPAAQRWKVRFEHVGGTDGTEKSKRYEQALRVQTGALSLGNLVRWCGAEASAARLFSEVDVLVVPSLREPCSLAMLEALAAGVPVLAGNAGGARDVIRSAGNGWLFRAGDPHDLARALIMLVETDALRTVTPAPGPDWRFWSPRVAQQWAEVYGRVLAASARSAAATAAR